MRLLADCRLQSDSRIIGFTDFQGAYVNFFGCSKNDRRAKTGSKNAVDLGNDETDPGQNPEETFPPSVSDDNESSKIEKHEAIVLSNPRDREPVRSTNPTKISERRSINIKLEQSIVEPIAEAKPTSPRRSGLKMKKEDTEMKILRSKKERWTNGPYTCELCGKKFRLRDSLKTHARIHTGEKQFTCHICGKQFGQTGCLYYHLKHVHGGVKNHSCDVCGRSFAMKTTMEDHKRSIHTGERPYVCDSCGKTFKTKSSLYIHSRTHTESYPHECKYCDKSFRWRQQLLGHLTIHTGEKNHSCDVCGKAFGVKNHLTRHKRTHSADKPFACQQCNMSFGQKRYLTTHQRLKHR